MASISPLPIMLDLDASPIPGQMGWAALDLQGTIVRNNQLSEQDAGVLFQMLQESTALCENTGMRRLTVTFAETKFLVSRDEAHVYLVQTRAA
jgi:hypothetical protein